MLAPFQANSNVDRLYLRSGLYLYLSPVVDGSDPRSRLAYAIYWPEDETWNDNAVGAVRKNRITFMRYLTRLADQVFSLISTEHASKLVWNDASMDADEPDFEDFGFADEDATLLDSDRFFDFEVVVRRDQDEGVTVSPGFSVRSRRLT
jgi:hypothetical protein